MGPLSLVEKVLQSGCLLRVDDVLKSIVLALLRGGNIGHDRFFDVDALQKRRFKLIPGNGVSCLRCSDAMGNDLIGIDSSHFHADDSKQRDGAAGSKGLQPRLDQAEKDNECETQEHQEHPDTNQGEDRITQLG